MAHDTKVITTNTRPIAEGKTKGNVKTRPEGPKPAAEVRPQGGAHSSSGNSGPQGSSTQGSNSNTQGIRASENPQR
jgi:hypothetical protein